MQETNEVHIDPVRIEEQQQNINEGCLEHEEFVHIKNSYGNASEFMVTGQHKLLEAVTDDIVYVKVQLQPETESF